MPLLRGKYCTFHFTNCWFSLFQNLRKFKHQLLYDRVNRRAGPFLIWSCKLLWKQVYKDFMSRKTMSLWCQIRNKPMALLIRSWNKWCLALSKFWSLWKVYHTYQIQCSISSYNPDHCHNVNAAVSCRFQMQLKVKLKSKQDKQNSSLILLVLKLKKLFLEIMFLKA